MVVYPNIIIVFGSKNTFEIKKIIVVRYKNIYVPLDKNNDQYLYKNVRQIQVLSDVFACRISLYFVRRCSLVYNVRSPPPI